MLKIILKPNKFGLNAYFDQSNHSKWLYLGQNPVRTRNFSQNGKDLSDSSDFQNVMPRRRVEAQKSILVESKMHEFHNMANYCAQFGAIRQIYSHRSNNSSQYFLIEYSRQSDANNAISSSTHKETCFENNVPIKSRFFSFNGHLKEFKQKNMNGIRRQYKQETNTSNPDRLLREMNAEKTIDKQITTLHLRNQISDLSYRLRFMAALQIEEAISGFFSNVRVLPFGSSVNGLGRMQSDLDMVVVFHNGEMKTPSPLTFINQTDRAQAKTPRQALKINLQLMANVMRCWLPGISSVEPILQARVPIIKYRQYFTDLDCDLSMGTMSGYYMSEVFYMYGQIDKRVQPLIFFIRRWAEENEITSRHPGHYVTNFMLSCLTIFFLQQLSKPILPPFSTFIENAQIEDSRITDDNVDCTYLRSLKRLDFHTENTNTLEELLVEFFRYYSSFDFEKNAISIPSGCLEENRENSSMYIVNPLERILNVSRNVSDYERQQFKEKCKTALNTLDNNQNRANIVMLLKNVKQNKKKNSVDSFVTNMMKPNRRRGDQHQPMEGAETTDDKNRDARLKKFDVKLMKFT